ncbi:MAG: phage integrase N-terminal SAM-like domain-containing protein [bacterium]
MSTLRKQMEADMALRGLAYRTRQAYIESVAKVAKFYGKSPDQISEPECQRKRIFRGKPGTQRSGSRVLARRVVEVHLG